MKKIKKFRFSKALSDLKNKIVGRACLIGILIACCFVACEKKSSDDPIDPIDPNDSIGDNDDSIKYAIEDIDWRFTHFVDVANNIMRPPAPDPLVTYDSSYWIFFNRNDSLIGRTAVNRFWAEYIVDYDQFSIELSYIVGTMAAENADGGLFKWNLQWVDSFYVTKDYLKLYYDEGLHYLLFEKGNEL